MATSDSTQEILDHLIEVCVDSEKRYRSAANDVGKVKLEQFFNQQADARKRSADELAVERQRLGGMETSQVHWVDSRIGRRWISASS